MIIKKVFSCNLEIKQVPEPVIGQKKTT